MLYSQRGGNPTETCMYWGFECGDGWYKLIDRLSAQLEEINAGLDKDDRIEAAQVKEKFGGLRFYTNGVPTKVGSLVDTLIRKAEKESYETCERCGGEGKPNSCGWISTLCEKCRKQKDSCSPPASPPIGDDTVAAIFLGRPPGMVEEEKE